MADHRPVKVQTKEGWRYLPMSRVLPAEPTYECHGECGARHVGLRRHPTCEYGPADAAGKAKA